MECQLYELDPAEYLSHEAKADLSRQGTPEAEAELFRQHQRQLFKMAADFHRLYPYLDLDDLLQAGALGLIRAIRKWEPDRSQLTTYAHHGMRNTMANLLRVARRYRKRIVGQADMGDDAEVIKLARSNAPEVAEQFDKAQESAALAAAIKHVAIIDPRSAQILRDRLAGDSLQQIADRLGLTKERVRQLESRAEKAVAEHAGGQAPAPGYKRRGA